MRSIRQQGASDKNASSFKILPGILFFTSFFIVSFDDFEEDRHKKYNPGTVAPIVSIASPTAGNNVAATINVTATATDASGIAGVQFLLDGNPLGAEDVTAPYSVSWNTTTASTGIHNLSARARNTTGEFTTSTVVPITVNQNLVASYGFNENTGTSLTDNSGRNNHGTLTNGPVWAALGKYGPALSFDGTNDMVNIADAATLDLTTGMTLEAWVNPSNLTSWKTVLCKDNGTNNFIYVLSANNNTATVANQRPSSRIANGSTSVVVNGTTKLPLNAWSHIASTFDGSVFRFYLNGVQVATLNISGTMGISTGMLRIGGSTSLANQYFAGLIDEVRIYNRALTAAEIQTDMNTPIATDAQAPTVNLTGPAAGDVAGTIDIIANASDNTSVAGVQFLLDGNPIGAEDISSPYGISWNSTTATNGNHTLSARARDAAGNTTTSATVAVNINNDIEDPTVAMTEPSPGTVLGTIDVSADADDNVGVTGVQFLLDGNPLGAEDITAPYSISWNTTGVTDGNHNLSARARDAAGNTTTSAAVAIVVQNSPLDNIDPTVSITAPTGGTVAATLNVTANANDNIAVVGVQFLLDGNPLGAEDISFPYSIPWNTTTTSNGNHNLSARARDAAGNMATSAIVIVNVNNVVVNPNLVASYGFNENAGTTLSDQSGRNNHGTLNGPVWNALGKYGPALSFDGTNDMVNVADAATLDLTTGMTLEAWVNPSNLTSWKTVLCKDNGTNNFIYVLSANNNTATAANQRPSSRIANGSTSVVVNGTTKLPLNAWSHIASTFDGSVFRFYLNGVQVATLNISGTMGISTGMLRIGGSTSLANQYFAGLIDEVRVYNRALTAAEIQTDMNTPIAPDTQAPTVTLTAPAAGNVSGTINVTANASDNLAVAGVQFLLDGNPLATEDITAPYSVSWNTETTTNGNHVLSARARDGAGNTTTSADVNVTVAPDFSFTLLTPVRNVETTGSTDFRVNVSYLNGYTTVGVNLFVDGLPSGVTGHFLFNPMSHQGETQLIINTSNASLGTYPITLTATSFDGISHTQQGTLTVTTASDFALTASPSIQNVTIGNSIGYTINLNETNDYLNPVTLSVLGLPAGITATFNPASAIPATTSTLTLAVATSVPAGTYNLTVQGTSGAVIRTVPISLTVSTTPSVWSVVVIGSTGTQNNCLRVGALKSDGLERVYVGTIGTGRMLEYGWNGSAWTGPVDVGGSPGGIEIHDCNIGDARGDGKDRLYAASYDNNIYEIWNDAGVWQQMTVGSLNGNLGMHMAMGNGRNDGVTRLYAASTAQLFEFTWNGTSWTRILIGSTPGAHGVVLGNGRNDAVNRIYVASISNGNYEVYWNGTAWVINPMGDNNGGPNYPDSRGIGIGQAKNDGINRVYAAIYDGTMREFTWNGTAWAFVNMPSTGINNIHSYIFSGRNDGINRLYTDNGNGKVWEYTWNGTGWTTYNMGGGSDYMYGLHYGHGRNDGIYRLYSTDRGSVNRVYEFTWGVPGALITKIPNGKDDDDRKQLPYEAIVSLAAILVSSDDEEEEK